MQKTPNVALLVETSKAYGRGVLRGIDQYVKKHGAWSVLVETAALTKSPPAWLASWRGDGIIARVYDPQVARDIIQTGLPVVNVSSIIPNPGFPCVATNTDTVARLAAGHLLECGFRHFGYLGERENPQNWSNPIRDFFLRILRAAGYDGCAFEPPMANGEPLPWKQMQAALGQWLRSLPKPVGILAINDWLGQQLLDACKRAGIVVPDQVAVVGVENEELVCDMADPPLTSIILNPEKSGYEAAALLDRMLRSHMSRKNGGSIPKQITIEPIGVAARRSTDIHAHEDAVVSKAIRFMRENACSGIHVVDVLKYTGVSRSTLDRRMLAAIGRTPHDEIIRIRIESVVHLLAHTSLKIAAVAERAGFEHVEYMGVVFRKETGMTPGEYRKRAQARLSGDSRRDTVVTG